MNEVIYKYIGNGDMIVGVPTRDLTEAEAMSYGVKFLVNSGLYKKFTPKPAFTSKPTKSAIKDDEAEKEIEL